MTLTLGIAGGWLFSLAGMPLAWMMGAMVATTVTSLCGVRLTVPDPLRVVMTMVLGVLLGAAFTPELMQRVQRWPISLGFLLVYVSLATAIGYWYFRRLFGWDRATAYFASAPGGLNEMVLVGGAMGGDERSIALVHSCRILFVVLTVPFWFRLFEGAEPGAGLGGVSLDALTLRDTLLLGACAVVGYPVARLLRLPASRLVGPMLASAAVHIAGVTESAPPDVAVATAQLVIGASIGARFSDLHWGRVLRVMLASLGSTALLLVLSVLMVLLLRPMLELGHAPLLLAFAPGGLAEMSLIALSLGVEVAFVATHHAFRILAIVLAAPLLFTRLPPPADAAEE